MAEYSFNPEDPTPMAIQRFPIEAGHIELFARAIGDTNPVYSDDAHAQAGETEGIIAPPTFVQAGAQFDPEYRLRPKIGQPWIGSGKTPTGLAPNSSDKTAGLLHAEQHFKYHRQLRPGDVLSATQRQGKSWEKEGRSGKLSFSETIIEYRDQNDELVITATSVGVITERPASND